MKKFLLIAISLLGAALQAFALPDILFNNMSTRDGLSSPHVYSITQDKYGLIWMGTDEGLFRYDGATFTQFMHDPKEFNSLWVNCVCAGADGRIWIGSENGLLFYSHESGKVEKCSIDQGERLAGARIKSLLDDGKGILWAGTTEGLFKYDYIGNRLDFFQLSHFKDKMTCEISSIHQDSEGNLWIGSFHGLYKYDVMDNSSQWFEARLEGGAKQWNNLVMDVVESPTDPSVLYVATSSGLVCINRSGDILRQLTTSNSKLSNNDIRGLEWFDDRYLLAGTADGLSLVDCTDFSIRTFVSRNDDKTSLAGNSIRAIFRDSSGLIWIATLKGVSKLNPSRKPISIYRFSENGNDHVINDIARIDDEYWLSTTSGILVCDTLFNARRSYSVENGLLHPITKRIVRDSHGCIWVGTNNGINLYDRRTDSFKPVLDPENKVRFKYIYDIKISEHGEIVSNVPGGIGIITPHYSADGKRVSSYEIRQEQFRVSPAENTVEVAYLCFDNDGYLWMCLGAKGLMRYSMESGEQVLIDETSGLQNNRVYSLFCGRDNTIWVGSATGLCSIDSNLDITDYSGELSLSGSIHSISSTSGTRLCLATYDKLILFNPRTKETNVCDLDEDLGVFELVHNSELTVGEEIFLGGDGQIIRFNPDKLNISQYAPEINIISLRHTTGGSGEENDAEVSLICSDRIVLPYDRNSFSILFAMPSYSSPGDNGYKYCLEGLDANWSETDGKNNKVTYTNLRWGKYTFRVSGHNSDGVWCPEEKRLEIVITPPWWASVWAYIVYVLLGLAIVGAIGAFLVARVRFRSALNMEKTEKDRIQQLNDMKLRFFTNISHEFKTPLTLISAPLEALMDQIKDPDQLKELEIIQQNSDRLGKLIGQIMDMRRIDNGKAVLELSHGDIIQFSRDIFLSFSNSARDKDIRLTFESTAGHLFISFDSNKFEKIIMNLMSNAMKFTRAGGEISLKAEVCDIDSHDNVIFRLSDTGCGIPKEDLPMVFDRFYQSRDSSNVNGSGIGLSIVKEYTTLHKGDISVESELGKGTCFTLRIPCDLETTDSKNDLPAPVGSLKSKIVIIDDEYDMLSFIKMNLENRFNVYLASDGETGYSLIKEVYPDLVICDLMMPGIDGYEVCRRVKSDDLLCHIPFIILTAKDDHESRREGYQLGADDYIAKPFSIKSLITRVNTLIDMRTKIRNSFKMQLIASPQDVATDTTDRMISMLVGIVEQNISDPDFGIQQLCDISKYPYQQIYRKIKSYTGQSINEFIRNIRLQRAAQLLHDPNYRISEVIDKVGFNSHSYFTKCFKELFGVSPTEYIQNSK